MNKHILLVDDDEDEFTIFLDALARASGKDQFRCTFANSPLRAIELLKGLVPDYIFIDFNIPKMNGLEFIAFVTGQPRFTHTRICLYSIHINEQTEQSAIEMGAACLRKTGTIDSLAKNLELLFSGKHLPGSPVTRNT